MVKRSPRYPRQNLSKSLDMIKKLFDGAHQSKLDADTAARVIGYTNSASGAASSALGALRQFGLVDGLRGDVGVSDLAMRILQPMDEVERTEALHEAAMKPEMFERIVNQFGNRLPPIDEPIRAYLIRQEGFSAGGADELIEALRQTLSSLPERHTTGTSTSPNLADVSSLIVAANDLPVPVGDEPLTGDNLSTPLATAIGELITLPLGQNCKAELRLVGKVTYSAYARLIRHLELLRDIAEEDEGDSEE